MATLPCRLYNQPSYLAPTTLIPSTNHHTTLPSTSQPDPHTHRPHRAPASLSDLHRHRPAPLAQRTPTRLHSASLARPSQTTY